VAHPLTMLMQMTGMHLDLLPAPSSCLEVPQQRQVSPRLQLPVDRPPSLLCANAHWRTSLQRKSRVATLNVAAAGEDAQESDEDKTHQKMMSHRAMWHHNRSTVHLKKLTGVQLVQSSQIEDA